MADGSLRATATTQKGDKTMKYIEAIEDRVIKKYGFEAKVTILVFRATDMLRRIMGA